MNDRAIRPFKAYSTRHPKPPPPEFEAIYIERGWEVINRMYGKRASNRWFVVLGAHRLREARKAYVEAQRATAAETSRSAA